MSRIRWIFVFVFILPILGCHRGAVPINFESFDYSKDVELREAYLLSIEQCKGPIAGKMGRLINSGGILAFRDYLSYLSKKHPGIRWQCREMPLYWGNPRELDGFPVTYLDKILSLQSLEKRGYIDRAKKYSYADIVQIVELTLDNWIFYAGDSNEIFLRADFSYLDSSDPMGPVFDWVEHAPRTIPKAK